MRRILLFLLLYFSLILVIFLFLNHEKHQNIKSHLAQTTIQNTQNYNILYDKYKKISTIIFQTRIDTQEVKKIFRKALHSTSEEKIPIRAELYKSLHKTYKLLTHYNIKQLHFHLPSNESFLRFHRPNKFGDDLSNIRETVAYVNENKKQIHGFEEGKIFNGFRHVYPLIYNKQYIGSVEVSFSSLAMSLEFLNNYKKIANFKILKSVTNKKVFQEELENYQNSQFEDFYVEKLSLDAIEKVYAGVTQKPLAERTKSIVKQRINKGESFSLYDELSEQVLTFISVENIVNNRVIGMFVLRENGEYIVNKRRSFLSVYLVIITMLAIIFYFIYRDYIYRDNAKKQNLYLKQKIDEEVAKSRKKDEQLLHQSKLAQMGEMINMIAHQWRQPLGSISSAIIGLKLQLQARKIDFTQTKSIEEYLVTTNAKYDDISAYTQVLSSTIDDFRNYFKEDNKKERVPLTSPVDRALHIVENSMKSKGIELIKDFSCNETLLIFQNEMMQVILNILKNSEDNFVEKKIKNATIKITTKKEKSSYIISILDNGGGVPKSIISKIFNPYFSTKKEKNGTGIGLYMSKVIIEEHNKGKLECQNIENGVEFKIILKMENENV